MKKQAEFIKSAVWSHDYPPPARPEIAMVGRSNAGKSSLINTMVGPTQLAKVSSMPGKTRLLNFFNVGQHYSLVDLPGYGFAKGGEKEYEIWNQMISRYFELRENLIGIILVCDIRREWTDDETMIENLAKARKLEWACVLTKSDKLKKEEIKKQLENWSKTSGKPKSFFFPLSTMEKKGVLEFENYMFKNWIKQK